MPTNFRDQQYDIAIIGSGISCSLTLLLFLRKLLSGHHQTGKKITIAVIEKEKEFWKGFPYGERSSVNSLTITTLGEFVPDKEKDSFYHWLKTNREKWMDEMKKKGGEASLSWIKNNLPQMQKDQWDDIYIPRFLFGSYIQDELNAIIPEARLKKLVSVELIHAEADDLRKRNDCFEISLTENAQSSQPLKAGRIILAIGSPPVRPLQDRRVRKDYLYFDDIYQPGIELNIEGTKRVFAGITEPHKRNILIIGSNASSLEFLYLFRYKAELKKLTNRIVTISYSGLLPHRITPNNNPDYQFSHLESLKKRKVYTSTELMNCVQKDLEIAYAKGVHIGDTYYQLSGLVVELLNQLEEGQQKDFYCRYGMKFTKLIRRAGAEYRDAAEDLLKEKKLELVKGRFIELKQSSPGFASFSYQDAARNKAVVHPLQFPVVINCSGFEELDSCSSGLINSLVRQKLCRINDTNRGFEVTEKFEASDKLYIMGPLLGGIFNSKLRYWHVENAKRIYTAGSMLVDNLVNEV